jgi:6-phosphogluconolactonase
MGHRVKRFSNSDELATAAAEHIHTRYIHSIEEGDIFTIALSGGKTPALLYQKLASHDFMCRFEWHRIAVFWGDERYVDKNDSESNFGMAKRNLLSKVPIPDGNIHAIPTEAETVREAAKQYEKEIREFFNEKATVAGSPPMPVFDLILLGLGKDGHTASLFPGNELNARTARWVEAVCAPPSYPTRKRITMTLPVLNSAAEVVFLVSGSDKAEIMERVLDESGLDTDTLPAQLIRPGSDIFWFTDF